MAEVLITGKQRSAKNAGISVGGVFLKYAAWNATFEADNLDTTHFDTGPVIMGAAAHFPSEGLTGVVSSNWSFSGAWDAAFNPIAAPPGIYPREDLVSLRFFIRKTEAPIWNYPFARVLSANCSAAVRELVTFEAAGMNQGGFLPPLTSV